MTATEICGVNNSLSLFILKLTVMAQFESLENFAEIIENEGHTPEVEQEEEILDPQEEEEDGEGDAEAEAETEETEEETEA